MATDLRLVMVTAPHGDDGNNSFSARLARTLVEEKLAACVNRFGPVRSVYEWDGKICDDGEELLIIKTTKDGFPALRDRIVELHPYDVPEIIAINVEDGVEVFLNWATGQVVSV